MSDSGKIIIGLIIFVLIFTLPITFNMLAGDKAAGMPEMEILPKAGKECVRSADYMRPYHMDLLNEWREDVVRNGDRFTEGPDGRRIEKSLTNTCLDCHSNKENFCDRCHNYMAVSPYCWGCHITPKEIASGIAPTPQSKEEN